MSELPDTPAIAMTVSMALSSARKELGLSQKDVADALFLNLGFIKHIDDNEIDEIPKKAFIRGYLRSYAKLVNLDPDAVVALYGPDVVKEEPTVLMKTIRPDAISKLSFTGPVLISSIVGLVCLILVIVLVWYFAGGDDAKPIVVSSSSSQSIQGGSLQSDPLQEVASEDAGNSEDNGNSEPDEAFSAFQESISAPSIELGQVDLPVTTFDESIADVSDTDGNGENIVIQRSTSGLTNYISVDAGGSDDLNFVFTDDCWLEVEDASGKSIYGDLGRAGDDLSITGEPPFRLLVGKPSVVSVKYNGDDIDLKPFITPARTAKLVLGDS